MTYSFNSAAAYYNSADLYGALENVDRHGLVTMLYNSLFKNINLAIHAIENKNIQAKCNAVNKCIDILDALRIRLNFEAGGSLAENLDSLYEYMQRRLIIANKDSNVEPLYEIAGLVDEIRQAWIEIAGTEI